MKRGGLILVLGVIAALAATTIAYLVQHQTSSVTWLQSEYHLDAEQMKQASALHDEYEATCAEMCANIAQTDIALTEAIRANSKVTPQIASAIAETDRVRTECRIQMLEHFYKTADLLPETQRTKYLKKVLPLVLHPGEMHAEHRK